MPTKITANDFRKTVNHYLRQFGTDPNDIPSEMVVSLMGEGHGPATAARIISRMDALVRAE